MNPSNRLRHNGVEIEARQIDECEWRFKPVVPVDKAKYENVIVRVISDPGVRGSHCYDCVVPDGGAHYTTVVGALNYVVFKLSELLPDIHTAETLCADMRKWVGSGDGSSSATRS